MTKELKEVKNLLCREMNKLEKTCCLNNYASGQANALAMAIKIVDTVSADDYECSEEDN